MANNRDKREKREKLALCQFVPVPPHVRSDTADSRASIPFCSPQQPCLRHAVNKASDHKEQFSAMCCRRQSHAPRRYDRLGSKRSQQRTAWPKLGFYSQLRGLCIVACS